MIGAQTAHHDPFASSLAGRRLGRYEVLARLASGGMAGVYVARAQGVAGFERLFAIKILHPHLAHEQEFITMFLDEARLAARIRHPNVVSTIDISDTEDAGYYLVMDYIEGDHLGALMRQAALAEERLPTADCLRIMVDALSGLGAAHELTDESGQPFHLVHRDVSPQNILVSTDGISRITDFGVAKAESRLATTREGEFKGKLAYMAPEHVSEGHSDQRSDLFAAGIVLWECLTGHRLFRAENQAATLNKVCLEPIPLPSVLDPELTPFDAISEKALQRDPEKRFQSALEFIEELEKVAYRNGGLGSRRTVAATVKRYSAEKLARERELIRTAIAALSNGDIVTPVPAQSSPPGSLPSYLPPTSTTPSRSVSRDELRIPELPVESPELPPLDQFERPSQMARESHKTAWMIGATGVVVAVLAVTFAFWRLSEPQGVITRPLDRLTSGTKSDLTSQAGQQTSAATADPTPVAPEVANDTKPANKVVEQKPSAKQEQQERTSRPVSAAATVKRDLKEKSSKKTRRNGEKSVTENPAPAQNITAPVVQETPPVAPPPKSAPSKRDDIISNPYR